MKQNIWGFPNATGSLPDSPIEVSAAGLAEAGRNGQLIPGATYRVVDYRSVNWLHGQDEALSGIPNVPIAGHNPKALHIGDVEPLLIKAVTTDRFDTVAYSEVHPMDVLYYDPYVQCIGLNVWIQNGVMLPNGSTPSDFDLKWDGTSVYFDMPDGYPVEFGGFIEIYFSTFDGVNHYDWSQIWELVYPGKNLVQDALSAINDFQKTFNAIVSPDGKKIILEGLTYAEYLQYESGSLISWVLLNEFPAYGWIRRRKCQKTLVDLSLDWRSFQYRRYQVNMVGQVGFPTTTGPVYVASSSIVYGWGPPASNLYTGLYKDYTALSFNDNHSYGYVVNVKDDFLGAPYAYYYYGNTDNFVLIFDPSQSYSAPSMTDCNIGTIKNVTLYNANIDWFNVNYLYYTTIYSGNSYNVTIDAIVNGLFMAMRSVNGYTNTTSINVINPSSLLSSVLINKTIYYDNFTNSLRLVYMNNGVLTVANINA